MKDVLIFLGWCAAFLIVSVAASYVRGFLDAWAEDKTQMTDVQAGKFDIVTSTHTDLIGQQPKTGMPVLVQPVQITDEGDKK